MCQWKEDFSSDDRENCENFQDTTKMLQTLRQALWLLSWRACSSKAITVAREQFTCVVVVVFVFVDVFISWISLSKICTSTQSVSAAMNEIN
jgi:hypothetical protein